MPVSTQYGPIVANDLTATIPSGQTESEVVDLNGTTLTGLFIPAAFDGTGLTIKAAPHPGAPFVTVQADGADYALVTAAGKYTPIQNLAIVAGLRYIKLVAATAQSTTETVITLATRPV